MKLLSFFQHTLGFTRNEMAVVLVLSGTFLIGVAIRWYDPDSANGAELREQFDYSASDSAFLELSKSEAQSPAPPLDSVLEEKSGSHGSVRRINLNRATMAELMRLPGIGPAYAERILRYRQDHGGFRSVGEMRRIKGIGKKKFEQLLPLITVEERTASP
jgi:comEA protein